MIPKDIEKEFEAEQIYQYVSDYHDDV